MATRWGIVSAGLISSDFVRAIQILLPSEHQVVAIAARNLDKAQEFAKRFNIPKAFGSYEELSKEDGIDVIYIGTIHPFHVDAIKLMLEAGKPVLCEKPLCMNVRQTEEVLELAKTKGLFLMEAFWSRIFPVYDKIRHVIKDGSVGEPRILHASLGMMSLGVDRVSDPAQGGGALLDIGCYPIQLADMVFGDKPEKIVASATLQETGVDDTTVVILTYPRGRVAVLTCSVSCLLSNTASIQCTNGIIEIPQTMWSPTSVIIKGEETNCPLPADCKDYNFPNGSGMAYEVQHVRECLLSGALESPLMTHQSTLNIARTMEEALRQVGVVYQG